MGVEVSTLLAWMRRLAARFTIEGADCHSAVDALRPHTQRIWRCMSISQRRRFLRHARVYWDIHRHRMAPEIELAVGNLRASGRLSLIAGTVVGASAGAGGVCAQILERGTDAPVSRTFGRVIDCTDLSEDPLKSHNPLIRTLLQRGDLRPDPLGIGLDVTEDFAIVAANGAPSRRVCVVGPLARAAFWECIAIPDIRVQCRDLAETLARDMSLGGESRPPTLA
jgi:uncharacterized NAD(P)/FAD-binding protein YdhS